jgi:hypothetical protein
VSLLSSTRFPATRTARQRKMLTDAQRRTNLKSFDLPLRSIQHYADWKKKVLRVYPNIERLDWRYGEDVELTDWLPKQLPPHLATGLKNTAIADRGMQPWVRLRTYLERCPVCNPDWTSRRADLRDLRYAWMAGDFGCENCQLISEVVRAFEGHGAYQPLQIIKIEILDQYDLRFALPGKSSDEIAKFFWASKVPSGCNVSKHAIRLTFLSSTTSDGRTGPLCTGSQDAESRC